MKMKMWKWVPKIRFKITDSFYIKAAKAKITLHNCAIVNVASSKKAKTQEKTFIEAQNKLRERTKALTVFIKHYGYNFYILRQKTLRSYVEEYKTVLRTDSWSAPRKGVIIEWTLNGQFHDHRDVTLTSQMTVSKIFITVTVI